jgi:hypothetical protein
MADTSKHSMKMHLIFYLKKETNHIQIILIDLNIQIIILNDIQIIII